MDYGVCGLEFWVWGFGFRAEIEHLNSRRDAREVEGERLSGPEARLDAHPSVQASRDLVFGFFGLRVQSLELRVEG